MVFILSVSVTPAPIFTAFLLSNFWSQTLLSTTTKRLLKIKGFSEIKVEKIKEAGKKSSVCIVQRIISTNPSNIAQPMSGGFMTASELGHIRKRCFRISTGSKQLDACLNGRVSRPGNISHHF